MKFLELLYREYKGKKEKQNKKEIKQTKCNKEK